jgi:hypothetical protein
MSAQSRPRCFVATSAFESVYAPEVQQLRFFRDHCLKKHAWGRGFTKYYYRVSPKIACLLDKHSWAKPAIRSILRLLIKCVR